MTTKVIIIKEYLKFINSDISLIRHHVHHVYPYSHRNVIWWDKDVEEHLKRNNIKYYIKKEEI